MNNNKEITIGSAKIGNKAPCYIIAEAGVNHNGSIDLALELVRKAKQAGVDCIKFQTFKAEDVATKGAPKANYQLKVTDPAESQFNMLKKLELDKKVYTEIINLCQMVGIQFMSTPYGFDDAKFLNELGVDAFKIASGQIVELPFLDYVAKFNKPIILSTGMATLGEVYNAVNVVRKAGNDQLVVLQCTTNYPSSIEDANINTMVGMRNALDVLVGYSDHVQNNYALFAAVALGAVVVEKHFTLDKNLPGPDHSSSLNPEELAIMVEGVRNIEKSLGSWVKQPTATEVQNISGMRRSIVAKTDLEEGHIITEKDITFKRPATGLPPDMLYKLIGKKLAKAVKSDTLLTLDSILWA